MADFTISFNSNGITGVRADVANVREQAEAVRILDYLSPVFAKLERAIKTAPKSA